MVVRVYRSLDRPSSLFGLRGSYLAWAGAGALGAAVCGFAVAGFTNGLAGVLVFIVLLAAAYFAVLGVQARFSERERRRWLSAGRLPDFIRVPPRRLSSCVTARFGTGAGGMRH